MTNSLLCVLLLLTVAPSGAGELPSSPLIGEVTYYNPGVMERQCAYWTRLKRIEPCIECVGMVALHLRYAKLRGAKVWLQRPGQTAEGPFQAVDFGRFLTPGRIAEVDWETARRWGMAGPVKGVRLYFEEPSDGLG